MIIQLTNAKCNIDKCIEMVLVKDCSNNYMFQLQCPSICTLINECILINDIVIKIPSALNIGGSIFEIIDIPIFKYKNLEIHSDCISAPVNLVDGYYWIQLQMSTTFTKNLLYVKEFSMNVSACSNICSLEGESGELMHIKG